MKIDTFITCVGENSLKFLKLTLGFNKKFFDAIYIITTYDDVNTQNFCETAGVNCLTTDLFIKDFNGQPAKFNRGAVLNKAIEIVNPEDWICSMDADILIKDSFLEWKESLTHNVYDPINVYDNFYGMPRVIIPTLRNLITLMENEKKENEFVSYPAVGHGYFQLWHSQSKIIKSGAAYPESYDSSESDWQWRNLWGETVNNDTEQTGYLKNIGITCLHLGEPNIEKNQNFWD